MQSDFFQNIGPLALGSRLRQVSERLSQHAAKIYGLYGVPLEPRWFPVLYSLMHQDNQSVAQLAEVIGHSQASVSQIVKEMTKRDFVVIRKGTDDGPLKQSLPYLTRPASICPPCSNSLRTSAKPLTIFWLKRSIISGKHWMNWTIYLIRKIYLTA